MQQWRLLKVVAWLTVPRHYAIVAHGVKIFLQISVTVRGVADCSWGRFLKFAVILAACSFQLAHGQEKYQTPQQTNDKIQQLAAMARVHPTDTPIGPGDLVHIDVFDSPELSRDVRVGDAGDISYPLIPGKITANGLTPYQLESKIAHLLIDNGLISHPQVSVFVKEQKSEPVTVVGAVRNTIVYQVEQPTTLLEVLSAAGGISDDAGSVVIVTRPVAPGVARTEPASTKSVAGEDDQKITIRLQDLLESGDSKYNIQVHGGDVVTVPRAGIVYILGFGVAQPGGYVLQSHGEQVTVLKALALAHGLTGFAKADAAVIMRDNPVSGQKDSIPVHIKQIENRKADDVPMKSNDILYVPDSRGKKILARGGEAALGVGTGVAIYRAY
jgi:polysaccharide biosynthesis/export protein